MTCPACALPCPCGCGKTRLECNQEKTRVARDRLQALATELNDADPEGLGIFIMVRKDHAESTCCNMDPPSMLEVLKEFISDDRRRNHLN